MVGPRFFSVIAQRTLVTRLREIVVARLLGDDAEIDKRADHPQAVGPENCSANSNDAPVELLRRAGSRPVRQYTRPRLLRRSLDQRMRSDQGIFSFRLRALCFSAIAVA